MIRDTDDPLYAGELRARADLTLAAILRALLVVLPVILIAGALGTTSPAEMLVLGVSLLYVVALFFLQRSGRLELCVNAAVFGLIVFGALIAALYGSVRSVGTLGQVAAITLGGLFLRRQSLLWAAGLSIGSLGALVYAENAGWLPAPNYTVTPSHWVIYGVIIAAVALVLSYMRSLLVDLVGRQRSEIAQRERAEAAQHQSEARFRRMFESSPVGMTVTRVSDGRYLEINRADERTLGYEREEMIGRSTLEMGAWLSAEERERFIALLRERRGVQGYETRMCNKAGETVECRIWADLVELDGEECILSSTVNVTDMRRAEEAVRDSEHRYRSLFQAAMDCILVISPQGAIVDINDFGCRSLGYTRGELIGGTFERILDGSSLSRMLPRPPAVKTERRTLRAEHEVRARDGSMRAVEFTAGPLPDGNVLVVARDITERRRNEKLLENIAKGVSTQTGAEFFRTLVMALCRELPADMAFIGEANAAGDRVRTIACCSEGDLIENFEYPLQGSPCILAMEKRGTVIHPERVAEQFPEDVGLAKRGMTGYAGTSLFDASGKAIGILVALTRVPIERRAFFVSMLEIFAGRAAAEIERARADAMVREINVSLERRVRDRTAELEAANKDLDSFGYSVSHDLRSPLGALNAFAHLLRTREAERLSADGAHLLRQVEANATRMTNLVEGLLEFSRLGRKAVTRISMQMAALVGEVVEELGAENRDRHLEFRVAPLPDAYGDPILLRQVWRNLVGNAVKYTRGREPALIEIGIDPATREYFVRDNGAGFDMQYAGRLFGVFERLHSESEFEGTGVGLAIVQRIVQRHGGSIRAEAMVGRGATFRFTLPSR